MFRFAAAFLVSFMLCTFPVQAAGFEQTFKEAQAAYKTGKYADAAKLFAQTADLLKKAKETAKAQMVLGNAAIAYMQAEDYASAVTVYENLLSNPGKTDQKVLLKSYKNLVICHSHLEQHALKIQTLERMMQALPKLPKAEISNVYAQMGDAYRALEIYAPASAAYDKAAHLLPQDADPRVRGRLLTAMGLCQGNMGDFAGASENLAKAKELAARINEPLTLAESDSNLGILYWERGDYPQALQLLNGSLETERKNTLRRNEGVDLNNLGLVKKSMGYFPDAIRAFEDALAIAREVGNAKDEAIALSNRALLNRITGKLSEARADYRAALELYERTGFQEGKAGALLGVGKIAEREDRDLETALSCYREALDIYSQLYLPRNQAEALLQIGGVLKQTALPGRTSRDLVFDDEPTVPKIDKTEALAEAEKAYQSALLLAEQVGSKEMLWAAHQGLGFCAFQKGQPEDALEHYTFAINLVTTMRTSLESVELLGEYMAGKEDLYSEAMEVCARLHGETQDVKYLEMQMQFDETLRNEIQKASAALVRMEFADTDKQKLYDKLVTLGRKQAKAESSVPVVASVSADASEETKLVHKIKTEEAEKQKTTVQQLDQDYQTLLTEWKEKYPGDAVIFESSARLDIPKIQQALSDDQVLLHYMQLTDQLVIVCISKYRIESKIVNISQKELNNLICKEFLVKYIEGSRSLGKSPESDKKHFSIAINILSELYKYLINPIEVNIAHKRTLYISSGGFLAQVPFSALISSIENKIPHFLVEKFNIGNIRPSFISALYVADQKKPARTLLAVGNPHNKNIVILKDLPGAKKEVENIYNFLSKHSMETDVKYEEEATDIWMIDKFTTNSYEILYFATHGVPYSEIYYTYDLFYKQVSEQFGEEKIKAEKEFITDNLPTFSPLNGYLFMSPNEIKKSSGLLTIKKIMELPDSSFVNTRYVILSACNTGVTFAPKTLKKDITINKFLESKDMEKELRKTGWIPGVDQISFVDAFMRKKVDNVYGTLWFADDDASAYLMNHFIENIVAQKEKQNAVAAFSETQRQYIKESKNGEKPLGNKCFVPLHPYFWAVGALFGK
ncbi:hypothetical protein WCP94_000973 [Bilophila wadsworthia]|uniref:CHAT domain-containing protein n=1 Tax=Bilophila wadsworthia TaxID=35833 RepID=UPI003D6E1D8E